jgi:hypothetical protein
VPFGWRSSPSEWMPLDLGSMDIECPYCGALHWRAEVYSTVTDDASWELCCKHGGVPPHPLPEPPQIVRHWFTANSQQARMFRRFIRQLNSAMDSGQ